MGAYNGGERRGRGLRPRSFPRGRGPSGGPFLREGGPTPLHPPAMGGCRWPSRKDGHGSRAVPSALAGSVKDGARRREPLRPGSPSVQRIQPEAGKAAVPQRPTVPQTDHGGRAEYAQANGRMVLKELGKLAPGSRQRAQRRRRTGPAGRSGGGGGAGEDPWPGPTPRFPPTAAGIFYPPAG